MRLERRLHVAGQPEILGRVDVLDAEKLLDLGDALFREQHRAGLEVDGVVHVFLQPRRDAGEGVVDVSAFLRRPADDEGRSRLVDEDVVDLVDDGVVQLPLDAAVQRSRHVVAQVVEAELVIRAVGHVGGVCLPSRARHQVLHVQRVADLLLAHQERSVVLEDAHGEAEPRQRPPVPLGVALGEIVVDGDQMGAAPLERVQVQRDGRDQRLALAGLQFGDLARLKDRRAHELHVVRALAHRAADGLTRDGERLGQDVIERLAVLQAPAKFVCLRPQRLVRERLNFGFEVIDRGDDGLELLELLLVAVAEETCQELQHRMSRPAVRLRRTARGPTEFYRRGPNGGYRGTSRWRPRRIRRERLRPPENPSVLLHRRGRQVDRPKTARLQLLDEVLDGLDVAFEVGGAAPDV